MHNNNVLCPPDQGQTEQTSASIDPEMVVQLQTSASLDPEMAVQLNNSAKQAQPIREEEESHMTELGPMGNCQNQTAENGSLGSHL